MKYILIWFIAGSGSVGPYANVPGPLTVGSQSFSTQEKCEYVAREIQRMTSESGKDGYVRTTCYSE